MTVPADPPRPPAALAALPGVADLVAQTREAFEALRWHPALRRRVAEVAAEGRVRGAQASAALDGARLPLTQVRELVLGLRPWQEDQPFHAVVRAAARAISVSADLRLTAPPQVLARLHLATVGAGSSGESAGRAAVGRPRAQDDPLPAELRDLGPAPDAGRARESVARVVALLAETGGSALVTGAVVHAEIALARPFVSGNLLVARTLERLVHRARGLDPLGVGVPEVGYWQGGIEAYVGALGAYDTGTDAGVSAWLERSAESALVGAAEGRVVADSVLRGSWSDGS